MRRTSVSAPSMRGVGVKGQINADIPRTRRLDARWLALDGYEWTLLAAFAVVSVWVVGIDLWEVVAHGRTWTGTDGVYITDQMQYLGWVVSSSHTGLIADLFVLHPTAAVYLQPAVLISGLLTSLGVPPALALLLWKPVAVVTFFLAVRAYTVRSQQPASRARRLAVISLALFYGCFSSVYGSFGVVGDMFPGFLSWGYPFALMAVAAAVFGLLSYDRARSEGRVSWIPGLLGGLAGSLHPWQGELFVLIVVGAELLGDRDTRLELRRGVGSPRIRLMLLTVATALVPLIYYYSLGKFNIDWELGQQASKHAFPALAIGLAIAPLALVALLDLRGPAGGFIGRSARAWPLAAVIIYLQAYTSQGATPLHAFDGVTLPLAVMAVRGCTRVRRRGKRPRRAPRGRHLRLVIAGAALATFTIPATGYEMKLALEEVVPNQGNPNFIQPGERRALAYLKADPDRGGVLSSPYLGMTVPGYTGRHTYDGDCIWSEPNCAGRASVSRALLSGQLPAPTARALVSSSHARFVLIACGSATAKLESELQPVTSSVARFGCASVIELRS